MDLLFWSSSHKWYASLVLRFLHSFDSLSVVFPSTESRRHDLEEGYLAIADELSIVIEDRILNRRRRFRLVSLGDAARHIGPSLLVLRVR